MITTINTKYLALAILLLLPLMSASQAAPDTFFIPCENGGKKMLTEIGLCRIYQKDGQTRKNCRIWEIKEYFIVYEQNGSLHDMLIEKIARIDPNSGTTSIYFDSQNRPLVKTIGTLTVAQTGPVASSQKAPRLPADSAQVIFADSLQPAAHMPETAPPIGKKELAEQAKKDAGTYYKGNGSYAIGIISGIFLFIGLVPVAVMAAVPPLFLRNSKNPNSRLLDNEHYRKAYRKKAHRKKAFRLMEGYLTGVLIFLALLILVFIIALG
jgi:hypothetical protein